MRNFAKRTAAPHKEQFVSPAGERVSKHVHQLFFCSDSFDVPDLKLGDNIEHLLQLLKDTIRKHHQEAGVEQEERDTFWGTIQP